MLFRSAIVAAFEAIQIGDSRDSVEEKLGPPLFSHNEYVHLAPGQSRVVAIYLPPPPSPPGIQPAPYLCGSILILYGQDRVEEKELDPSLTR